MPEAAISRRMPGDETAGSTVSCNILRKDVIFWPSKEPALRAYAPTVDLAPRCSYGSRGLLCFLGLFGMVESYKMHLTCNDLEQSSRVVFMRDGPPIGLRYQIR